MNCNKMNCSFEGISGRPQGSGLRGEGFGWISSCALGKLSASSWPPMSYAIVDHFNLLIVLQ